MYLLAGPKLRTMHRFTWALSLLCFSFSAPLLAQPGSIEGTQIEIESMLIDAGKQKLLGNQEEAITSFQEVLKKDDNNATANYELARLFSRKGDFEKARSYVLQAVNTNPTNVWYRLLLADLYQETGENQKGADVYAGLRASNPDNPEYYYKEAFYLVRANKLREAQRVYSDLENIIGVSEELIRRRHTLYLGMGDQKKAARELEKLTEAFPKNISYWHLLAEFYQKTGLPKNAQKVYQKILTISPNDPKANLAIRGGSLEKTNDVSYLNQIRPVFEDPGTSIDLKIGRLMPLIEKVASTGDQALADEILLLANIVKEVHSGQAKAFALAADVLFLSNRPDLAVPEYIKALELDDSNFLLWENLFIALDQSGNYSDLVKWSEEAMFIYPNQALVYYMNGLALQALDQPNEALGIFNEALLIAGNNLRIQQTIISAIGLTYAGLGDAENADDAFQKAIEINEAFPLAKSRYAAFLAKNGIKTGITIAKEVVSSQAENPETLYRAGMAFFYAKQGKDAQKWVHKALQQVGESHPEWLETYGDILFENNDETAALEAWKKAQEKGRNTQLLQKKISDKKLYKS